MAVGYKKILGQRARTAHGRLIVPFQEEMWGSVGRVTELYDERGPGHSHWPTIEVDCEWPGGMSGGPIFDEDGCVVGIVSRSGLGAGHGVWLQAVDPRSEVLHILHPKSPGWIQVWAAFEGDSLICSSPDRGPIEAARESSGSRALIELVAQNVRSHEYVRSDGIVRRAPEPGPG